MAETVARERASASDDVRSVRLSPIDRLADHMAEGCPSVAEAARRMRIALSDADALWARIRRGLGRQAA